MATLFRHYRQPSKPGKTQLNSDFSSPTFDPLFMPEIDNNAYFQGSRVSEVFETTPQKFSQLVAKSPVRYLGNIGDSTLERVPNQLACSFLLSIGARTMNRRRRQYGERLGFKSLACAPINEHGVLYLFGVLHDVIGFRIESIQAGFPDCMARRAVGKNRWEDLRIEFEFESRSFDRHGHDPEKVDMIVCWKHNWKKCPAYIEVIELSKLIKGMEEIQEDIKKPKRLSAYNLFCQEKVQEGYSFKEIAEMWRDKKKPKTKKKKNPHLTSWQQFCSDRRLEGIESFAEIGRLWRDTQQKQP